MSAKEDKDRKYYFIDSEGNKTYIIPIGPLSGRFVYCIDEKTNEPLTIYINRIQTESSL